jgi:hypothetical protein
MTITAKSILSSRNQTTGVRIDTMLLRYPRFIHAEFMTHRVFSRNASSSRAIPVERLIQDVIDNTAMPIHWGKNQPGMQAREEHDASVRLYIGDDEDRTPVEDEFERHTAWDFARDNAINVARAFAAAGYHKQIVNRLLEPFSHINVVVTATEWENFFKLRDHEDAQPEIRALAQAMKAAMKAATVQALSPGEWHIPFITSQDQIDVPERDLRLVSAARAARTSYLAHDGRKPVLKEDLALARKLLSAVPMHASPFEHQAMAMKDYRYWANFRSWRQQRWDLENPA